MYVFAFKYSNLIIVKGIKKKKILTIKIVLAVLELSFRI